ncbi:GGDEF domain-containing protein [Quadrisphaera setariae]|uniref:GGDEF domain-containing protein n=1 Tax=Quadrisphaera setariae TaxID=2593304 RepID=A0A5C8ZDG7_9ACTN|nr:GGDEF domain-containing protein [Quadrisphaera setariae]TXR56145.1 GGDEF domain-containing protein [Quadrisphaera setariae]
MTDPSWGLRVLGFATAVLIVVLVGLDGLPQPPDASHAEVMGISLVSAVGFVLLRPSSGRRLAPFLLSLGPVAGCAYVTAVMRLVDSPVTAASLSLLQVLFVIFCALYGRRWHSVLVLGIVGPATFLGLQVHVGAASAATLSLTAVAVMAVSSLILTAVSEQVRLASTTDALTGAASRRGLQERAPGFALRHRGRHRGAAVVVLDLDGFKTYNDVHGHAAGDALLVEAVRAWSRVLPAGSLLARSGGDEFVALVAVSQVGAAAGADLLDELRRAAPDGVRASAGSAPWPVGTALEGAVHEADRAMYLDKGERRRSTDEARATTTAEDAPDRTEVP